MNFDLAQMAREKGVKRKSAQLRPIMPTKVLSDALYAIYLDSVDIWRSACRELVAAYTEPEITTDASPQQLQWLVDQEARKAEATVFIQTEKLGRWVARVGTWHGSKTITGVRSALGVDIEPFIRLVDVQEQLQASIRENVSLIQSVNSGTRARIEAIMYDATVNRRSKKYLTDELAKAMAITKRRARNIALDQTHKLGVALTGFRNLQMGIKSYIWETQRDDRVRKAHRARQGQKFSWERPPYDGPPSYPPGCRCEALPVVEIA